MSLANFFCSDDGDDPAARGKPIPGGTHTEAGDPVDFEGLYRVNFCEMWW